MDFYFSEYNRVVKKPQGCCGLKEEHDYFEAMLKFAIRIWTSSLRGFAGRRSIVIIVDHCFCSIESTVIWFQISWNILFLRHDQFAALPAIAATLVFIICLFHEAKVRRGRCGIKWRMNELKLLVDEVRKVWILGCFSSIHHYNSGYRKVFSFTFFYRAETGI